jgi:hypothetical protein
VSVRRQSPGTLRREIVTDLELDGFPLRGYRDEEYLQAALEAGYDVATLAQAHDVAKKTIYRALEDTSIEVQKPPSNGPAKRLWELDPDAIGGGR